MLPAVLVVLVVLGVTGCGADSASSEGAAADDGVRVEKPQPAPEGDAGGGDAGDGDMGDGDAGDGDAGAGAGAEAGVGQDEQAPVVDEAQPGAADGGTGRRVVTSTIDVAVEDVAAAADEVRLLAVRVGGEVADESSEGGERPRAEIVLRVPSDDTPDVLEEVAALGEEVARTSDSEPVQTRLVDLESRTATQRAGVERIRALLEQATSLEDVLTLEAELTRRQADLESVDAQRAALADLARLATVTVRLTTPEDAQSPERELPPFLQGLDAGWDALVASTTVVLVVLGGLLPFAVVAALVLAAGLPLLRALRRRRLARSAAAPAPLVTPTGPPAP